MSNAKTVLEEYETEWPDDTFHVLSNPRRRRAIAVLSEHGSVDQGELVDRVSEREFGMPIGDIESEERHRVYVSIQQTHLGALEDADVISWDGDVVRRGDEFDDVAKILELAKEHFEGGDNPSLVGRTKRAVERFR